MIPVTQTILHNPDEGKFGNCFSAVLASLLHIPIEDVPVFKEKETWKREVNEFLRPYNLAFFDFMDYPVAAEFGGVIGLYHEQAGNTVRGKECSHACVAVDGKVIHDPHPNGDGLQEIYDYSGVFVCLEPWQLIEARKQIEMLESMLVQGQNLNDVGAPYGIIDPDYARVYTKARCTAWQYGYALMMHGSFTRDLDLLAVPWQDSACSPAHLIQAICYRTGLKPNGHPPTEKPHGRLAHTLMFDTPEDPRFIDISVMPVVKKGAD